MTKTLQKLLWNFYDINAERISNDDDDDNERGMVRV